MTKRWIAGMLGLLSAFPMVEALEKQARVRLQVVDEADRPVPQARVLLFLRGLSEAEDEVLELKANAAGLIQHKGWSKGDYLDGILVISKTPGYYESRLKQPVDLTDREFDLRLKMRKIGQPIAMYAKKVELELPEQRREIGFDFEKGDWVKPYGKGEVADCTFIGTKHFEDQDHFETSVVMSFPSDLAGMLPDPAQKNKAIQLSKFKTSRMAPLKGYQHTFNLISRWDGENRQKGSTGIANWMFRSRVVAGEDGELKSCHYGKIVDGVDVARRSGYPDGNPIITFTYYFNPTPNDRNLEFDPRQNLFKDLRALEEVSAP